MTQKELFSYLCQYAIDILTYEEYHSMGLEGFHNWVKEHIIPIPKAELVIGQKYPGYCKNTSKAVWNGKVFQYMRKKYGSEFLEQINHYEDDNNDGIDVFVPIKEI